MSDVQKVQLWCVTQELDSKMKAQIFETQIDEDRVLEAKGKDIYEGELKVKDLDESNEHLRFFASFGKARDCITDLLRIRIQAFKDVKNEFHAVRLPDVKKVKV